MDADERVIDELLNDDRIATWRDKLSDEYGQVAENARTLLDVAKRLRKSTIGMWVLDGCDSVYGLADYASLDPDTETDGFVGSVILSVTNDDLLAFRSYDDIVGRVVLRIHDEIENDLRIREREIVDVLYDIQLTLKKVLDEAEDAISTMNGCVSDIDDVLSS